MSINGKIIALLFSLLCHLPWSGTLCLLLLGHAYDRGWLDPLLRRAGFRPPYGRQAGLAMPQELAYLFCLMGRVAKLKGVVSIEAIHVAKDTMRVLGLSARQRRAAQNAFRTGKAGHFDLSATLLYVRQAYAGNQTKIAFFFHALWRTAQAGGGMTPRQSMLLTQCAIGLGYVWQQGRDKVSKPGESASELKRAYACLGVSPDVTQAALKRAYRKQMNRHHPDKLPREAPMADQQAAKEKTQTIQSAYRLIKTTRGFS